MRRRLPTVTPRTYLLVAYATLGVLTLIVFTGAAVRLTGSGLGCPDWPKCQGGRLTPELGLHGLIEFGNRLLTGVVGLPCVLAFAFAFRRRPYRRELMVVSLLICLGVAGQAVLGGLTVWYGLAPGYVMAHHGLSMLLLVAAVTLVWRSRREPGHRARSDDRRAVWAVRSLAGFGAVTIFAGTVATAAGPHAGGEGTGDEVNRLEWKGLETLDWAIHQHARLAALLGVVAVGVWWLLRRRGADSELRRTMTWLCGLMAAQGVVGTAQYMLELPAGLVWLHVSLAAVTWVVLLWAVAAAGRLVPRGAAAPAEPPAPAPTPAPGVAA